MVEKWFTEIWFGCTSTNHVGSSKCKIEVATPEALEKVHDNVLGFREMKMDVIVEAIGISDNPSDFEWSLEDEKVIRKMGVVFTHNRA